MGPPVAGPTVSRSLCADVDSQDGYYNGRWNVNATIRTISTYGTDFIGRRSNRFLRAAEVNDRRPWLMYLAPAAPHGPYTAEPEYAKARVPRWDGSPSVFEKNLGDKPPYVSSGYRAGLREGRRIRRAQFRTLMSVDDMVEKVFESMGERGEFARTLAFYISDNGYLWGEHGLTGKTVPYAESIEVPFFMRAPGAATRRVDSRMAANVDIAPTILDAAGISQDSSQPMEGRSLLDSTWRRERMFTEYQRMDNVNVPTWASIRTPDYQYVEYYSVMDSACNSRSTTTFDRIRGN